MKMVTSIPIVLMIANTSFVHADDDDELITTVKEDDDVRTNYPCDDVYDGLDDDVYCVCRR